MNENKGAWTAKILFKLKGQCTVHKVQGINICLRSCSVFLMFIEIWVDIERNQEYFNVHKVYSKFICDFEILNIRVVCLLNIKI